MLSEKYVVDIPGIIEILDGFDPNKPPAQRQVNFYIHALIDAERNRQLFDPKDYSRKRGVNTIVAKNHEEIEAKINKKYYNQKKDADGSTTYTMNEEALKKEPEVRAIIQREMRRHADTLDPISGMKFGEYIGKAKQLFKTLNDEKPISSEDLGFLKTFTRRINDHPSTFLMDFGDEDKRTPPADQQFRDLPGDKFTVSPVFRQLLGAGGGEDLERFEGMQRAISEYESTTQEMRRAKVEHIPGFQLANLHKLLFNQMAEADWKKATHDGKEVMTTIMDVPEGLASFDATFKDMAKANGLSSMTAEFKWSDKTLEEQRKAKPELKLVDLRDTPPHWQAVLTVSREEYENRLSPVVNRAFRRLKAGANELDEQGKSYAIAIEQEEGGSNPAAALAPKIIPGLLKRLDAEGVQYKTEPGRLLLSVSEATAKESKMQDILKEFDGVLSIPERELGGYVIPSRDALKPEQEKALRDRLAEKGIVYTAKQETFISIDRTEYDKKIAPVIEKIEDIGRSTPASPRTEVEHEKDPHREGLAEAGRIDVQHFRG